MAYLVHLLETAAEMHFEFVVTLSSDVLILA